MAEYFEKAGLQTDLDKLGFNLVGFGCTTCIGNSGPLQEAISETISGNNLVAVAVLSGNRNFEGRVNPDVRANYLASPPLVVAYALAGSMAMDLVNEPLGLGSDGKPVYLRDIWPSSKEVQDCIDRTIGSELFKSRYSDVFSGDTNWKNIGVTKGQTYEWDSGFDLCTEPALFRRDDKGADTSNRRHQCSHPWHVPRFDHHGSHLACGVDQGKQSRGALSARPSDTRVVDFNQYGTRRGNHEVMMRGTFANIRIKNQMVKDEGGKVVEGGYAIHQPSGERMSIYDAAMRYQADKVPLVVFAGKEYGTGSSRDWAAKGTNLLGIRAVVAESFERIHRSNLVGMGVMPLVFEEGTSWRSLGLKGDEIVTLRGIESGLVPRQKLAIEICGPDGARKAVVPLTCRIDTLDELEYFRNGGILQYVLRQLAA